MANMSYCRFHNTLGDLRDCYDRMEEVEELSDAEAAARVELIKLCASIADDYRDDLEA